MMIQKKIYGLMIQRLSIALLMMALSVSTMRAAQTIKVDITGVANATWSLTVDGASVTFTNGVASVSDKADKTAVLTLTPNSGYEVFNFKITEMAVFSPTRSDDINIGNNITYSHSGSTYTFKMPANESRGVYISAEIMKNDYIGITSLVNITETGKYVITDDIDASGFSGISSFAGELTAAIDPSTHMPYRIKNLSKPLFTTLTGTVKNLVLEDVGISGNTGNTGAIACTANSAARIYNVGILSGSVGGTTNTGGLVGFLDGTARVINCYSYADITGGSDVGGIVGYNNVTTTSANNNQKTMVMNCMFYGDITGSTTISPIYGGKSISNAGDNGVGNYNYFRLEAPYVKPTGVTYNCALGAEDRFLKRFEFFRHLLNSHRELAGWWSTGTYSSSDMMKWVLEPSQLDSDTPYPILKVSGKYPSVVNIDAEHATTQAERNKGGKLGTLSVKIQMGDGAVYQRPSGAQITTSQLTLNITDKDPDHYNFNYYKVQLPYYNDVGTKNYNGNRVVTGWKIVSITGGTPGTFTASDTWGGYNFADRNCTNKDLYGTGGSNRIFNQGAYWDVPEGVTAITIEPYWAKCVYLADPNADKVYNTIMDKGYDVPNVGGGLKYTNGNSYSIAGENQVVFTSIGNAIASSGSALFAGVDANSHSVYDYAVVLVGNYHHYYSTGKIEASKSKPYTVTSIDLDDDNEPDYSYILRFDGRTETHPVRADFINIPGLGMAQKSTGGTGSYNFGILIPKGWYESTNTSLLRFTQFEYEHSSRSATDAIIVQGGVMEQWVSNNQKGTSNKIPYIHVGGNVWFKEFHTGCHQDKKIATTHSPISVTGGDYDEFYLTGLYQSDITSKGDNAECYINGGRFGTVCGAAMEGIGKADGADNTGNITWQIQNADIHEFYAGGLNAAKPVTGNLSTTIVDSHVDIFCGGPKFGDMSDNKTVVTNATGCTFGTFFGAGYGGNSFSRYAPSNQNNVTNINWNNWVKGQYTRAYNATYGGVSTQFSYQFLPMSDNKTNVARIFVDFVKFSLATCRNVTSTLTGCKITGNFYGGGSLGSVEGNVTSTLTDCEVSGSAFGAGFSASLPTVEVDSIGFRTEPYYYTDLGTYRIGEKGPTTTYTWQKKTGDSWVDNKKGILYTTEDLTSLGTVTGLATLNINGTTTVAGSVYGGGEESNVSGNTNVYICAEQNGNDLSVVEGNPTITGNVFGGGKGKDDNFRCDKAMVGVNDAGACEDPASETNKNNGTRVIIGDGTVNGNVYGGGEVGRVEWNTQVTIGVGDGTPEIMGNVFGAGAGKETHGYSALVRGNSSVTVQGKAKVGYNVYGGGEKATVGRYWVKGIPATPCSGEIKPEEPDVPNEMPYKTRSGGKCTVIVQGEAQIGPTTAAADKYKGHVFGAGKGVEPNYIYGTDNKAEWSKRMVDYDSEKHKGEPGTTWDYYVDEEGNKDERYVWEYFATKDKYLEFLQSLALVTSTDVTINGSASVTSVKGSVYGGSESGFVQDDTKLTILAGKIGAEGTTTYGNVFGGGRGLSAFAEAGKVKGNTEVVISGGTTNGSVYGGGELGDVGTINKTNINSYRWTDMTNEPYDYNNTGVCTVSITGASAEVKGHVFGAGKGEAETFECEKAMVYDTSVSIRKGTVNGNVFGGGQIGRVENNTGVTIGVENETKSETPAPLIKGSVFGAGAGVETHGYSALMRGNTAVTIQGNAKVNQNVYGGGEIASVGRYWVNSLPRIPGAPEPPEGLPLGMPYETRSGGDCTVTIRDNAIIGSDGTGSDDAGNVFGAGKGVNPHFDPGNSKRMFKDSEGENVWDTFATEAQYLSYLETLGLATKPVVTVTGNSIVKGSVFGGGEIGITKGSVNVNISGGTVTKDVYGGGALANTNYDNWNTYTGTWTTSKYNSETHETSYTTEVALTGGIINGNVYGGGLGRKAVAGQAAIGEEGQDGYVPAVEAVKGVEAKVYGDVLVKLNETYEGENSDDCIVKGSIFGCNNLNGSPQNAVTVHVYKTVGYDDAHKKSASRNGSTYDLEAVYGGGNQAAFVPYSSRINAPDDEKARAYATVIIDGCDLTSIKQVYGGGNAAATPGTNVIVNSTYEIDEVFGGGNGLDDVLENGKYYKNPGANVGYGNYSELDGTGDGTIVSPYNCKDKENASTKELRRANYMYGSGAASVNIYGGRIHRVFGGSNTKGNVCETAVTILDNEDPCMLNVDEAYGGGKSAPMDAEAKLLMACLPGLNEVYGGAQDADVMGDVTLNITNGTFDRVFGGNNISGTIHGNITVNIEETGCKPLIIGELYGGGNRAPYSVYGYNDNRTPKTSGDKVFADPVINVKSFTSIGNIYGGGYGETAVLYGDPTVNVNVVEGKWKDKVAEETDDDYGKEGYMYDATGYKGTTKEIGGVDVIIPPHEKGKIGAISNVFGGGNAAPIVGNTNVNIGTMDTQTFVSIEDDPATTEVNEKVKTVKGVDIRGNVYGGGNNAEVTGNTNVVIGRQETPASTSPARSSESPSESQTVTP